VIRSSIRRMPVSLIAVVSLLTVSVGTTGARAQSARQLTLEEALTKAKKRNWSLAAEQARLEGAQTSVASAWALLLPTIAAQGKYTRNYAKFEFPIAMGTGTLLIQPINQLDGVISFTAPLIVPAAYPGLKSVKANVGAAEASYQASEDNVLFTVAQTFYGAAGADQVLVARQSSISVAKATLVNAQTRLAAGTVTKVDVDRAELALVREQQLAVEARDLRDQLYRSLRTLTGIQETFVVETTESPTPPPAAKDDVPAVLQLRPEFRAIERSTEAAHLSVITDALKWSPSISAFGNARRFNYDNFNQDNYSWAVGLQLDWLIFDGGARDSQRHLAAAQERESKARAQVLTENISDALADARSQFATKQSGVQASERALTLAKETLELVRTQYEAGTITQVDLLAAQDALVGSELALARARFDLAVADLTYRHANGTFPPR
jgi:outer membrane protein TolC